MGLCVQSISADSKRSASLTRSLRPLPHYPRLAPSPIQVHGSVIPRNPRLTRNASGHTSLPCDPHLVSSFRPCHRLRLGYALARRTRFAHSRRPARRPHRLRCRHLPALAWPRAPPQGPSTHLTPRASPPPPPPPPPPPLPDAAPITRLPAGPPAAACPLQAMRQLQLCRHPLRLSSTQYAPRAASALPAHGHSLHFTS